MEGVSWQWVQVQHKHTHSQEIIQLVRLNDSLLPGVVQHQSFPDHAEHYIVHLELACMCKDRGGD